jgi:hypothetical protein
MVNLTKKVIELQGKTWPITSFGVYWHVPPYGLFATLDEVNQFVEENELSRAEIQPVSVALTDTPGIYEVI